MMIMNDSDKKNVQDAISLVIQQRYVWLFIHIARGKFLDLLDRNPLEVNIDKYFFSLENLNRNEKSVNAKNILLLLAKGGPEFASSKDGTVFDWRYTREITIDGIRGPAIVMIQSYLEKCQILKLFRSNGFAGTDLFDFIRIMRNIVCHSREGKMTNAEEGIWRDHKIFDCDNVLKMSDQQIFLFIDDIIEALTNVCLTQNIEIDYVSLNLGLGIPAIDKYINNKIIGETASQ